MIGPPGLPRVGRRVFYFGEPPRRRSRLPLLTFKWLVGLYLAGVLAHFSHHMACDLPVGTDPSLYAALASAPTSLAWPADLIGTLLTSS